MTQKNKYFKWGATAFCTVAAILLFYDTIFGSRVLVKFCRRFISAAQPVIYGAFMAYLLAPIVNFLEMRTRVIPVTKTYKKGRKVSLAVRAFSIFLTWTLIGALLYLLGAILVPELYKSILQLVSNVETYYNTVSSWIVHMLETYPSMETWVAARMDTYYEAAKAWVQTDLLPQATTLMTVVSGGVFSVVGFLGDLLVGIIVSVYFLATKELCAAHARKVVYALFPEQKVYWVLRGSAKADRIFSGFVRGKLLDSLIIGMLCFIGCSALKFPYTPLVSVIVGITNVIPFFGPFLGAIPSTFLILLVSPIKAVYFLLFILALQQLDGNVIGPKILGDKTGLSSLWVIMAILVGGSFFGFIGMFFGVPVFACLYSAVNFWLKVRLRKRGLPAETRHYVDQGPAVKDPEDAEIPPDQ